MENKIICIGRECGSGGHEIALRLGESLGLPVYERSLLHLACRYGELAVEKMEAADEKATNPYLYQTVHEGNHHVSRGLPTSEVLFALQSHEICRIAASESCIFVGRCANYVLRSAQAAVLSVFITAPLEQRIQRKAVQENLSPAKARHLVNKMDKQRKKYYEHYAGQTWGHPGNYDMVVDCGQNTIEQAVELIARRYAAL